MAEHATGDCPECEICCAIGACCAEAQQRSALLKIFMRETHEPEAECAKYADAFVSAMRKARKHEAV